MIKVDVCVLGAGPGGYVSAIRSAQNGLSTICVEKDNVGGICLNWGCIPTKALLHCAHTFNVINEGKNYGINTKIEDFDILKTVDFSRNVVTKLSNGVETLFKKHKVKLIKGFGQFINKNTLEVKQNDKVIETINAKYFIIATGARPRTLNYQIDENAICTYRGAMTPTKKPKNVAIIGGGVIGVEFANFYNAIGCKTTILQHGDDILKTEDSEIRKKAKNIFIKNGIDIQTNVDILSHEKINNDNVKICYKQNNEEKTIIVDKLIISIGVIPNIENFGLQTLGIEIDKNCIKTDEKCKTNIDNIYAIGDCTYGPWLAHKASREGIIAADDIANKEHKLKHEAIKTINKSNIPNCIYSFPQIASIGLTEDECKIKGIKYKIGTFSGIGNGKSIATNTTDNFIKIIIDEKTNEILGCHMIGDNMTEIIHTISICKTAELLPEDLDNVIFAHPTISEMIPEAILDIFNRAIHK